MSQHNTIFKDMLSVLKRLLKVLSILILLSLHHHLLLFYKDHFLVIHLQNYSNIHREFLELCHTIVKHTLHIDRTSAMKYDGLLTKMKQNPND